MDEKMEVYETECVYKRPLLDKPPVLPSKKPLLHHPNEAAARQINPPLHGFTSESSLGQAPWPVGEIIYDNEETFTHTFPPATKKQALLPSPGEWKADLEKTWTSGLLPHPIGESPPLCGLLPPHLYTSPPQYLSPSLPLPELTHAVDVSPWPQLLSSPRPSEAEPGIESSQAVIKKTPLLQTPSQQGTRFSSNKNSPLIPHVPITKGRTVQDQARKPPLLAAPPSNGTSAHLKRNEGTSYSNNGQHCPLNKRKTLISTPPVISSHPSRMGSSTNVPHPSHSNRVGPNTHVSHPSHSRRMGPKTHGPPLSHPIMMGPNTHVSHRSHSGRMGPNVHGPPPSHPSMMGPNTHGPPPSHPGMMGPNTHVSHPSHSGRMGPNTHGPPPSHLSMMGPNVHNTSPPSHSGKMVPVYKEQASSFHQTGNVPPRNNRPLLPTPRRH